MGAFSIWHWLVVLAIVVVVFGTKKLRNVGGDLGSALKGFKEGIKDSETDDMFSTPPKEAKKPTIEGNVNKTETAQTQQTPPSPEMNSQSAEGDIKEKTETKVG